MHDPMKNLDIAMIETRARQLQAATLTAYFQGCRRSVRRLLDRRADRAAT